MCAQKDEKTLRESTAPTFHTMTDKQKQQQHKRSTTHRWHVGGNIGWRIAGGIAGRVGKRRWWRRQVQNGCGSRNCSFGCRCFGVAFGLASFHGQKRRRKGEGKDREEGRGLHDDGEDVAFVAVTMEFGVGGEGDDGCRCCWTANCERLSAKRLQRESIDRSPIPQRGAESNW